MIGIPDDIAEQVRMLESLRAAGHIDDSWYLRTRASIVRRHRELRQVRADVSAEAFRTTLELQRPA